MTNRSLFEPDDNSTGESEERPFVLDSRYKPIAMTATRLREILDSTFDKIARLVEREDGARIAHLVAHDAPDISGTVAGFLDVALDVDGRLRHLISVALLTDGALIDVLLTADAKRPTIDFFYQVNDGAGWLCPCDILDRPTNCTRVSGVAR